MVVFFPVVDNQQAQNDHQNSVRLDMYRKNFLFLLSFIYFKYTICVCKLDYHGSYCQDKINACLFRIEHHLQPNGGTLIAGNTACNVNSSGNKCVALISAEGDASYQCQCNETHWIPDIELPYPNCLQKQTKCDSIVCVHGFCVSNNHTDQVSGYVIPLYVVFYRIV